eukprot:g12118.t1
MIGPLLSVVTVDRAKVVAEYRSSNHRISTASTPRRESAAAQAHGAIPLVSSGGSAKEHSEFHFELAKIQELQEVLKSAFVSLVGAGSIVVVGSMVLELRRPHVVMLAATTVLATATAQGIVNALCAWAEQEFRAREHALEMRETVESPDEERREMTQLYQERYGFSADDASGVAGILSNYPLYWVQHMLGEELGWSGSSVQVPVPGGDVGLLLFAHLALGLLPVLGLFLCRSAAFSCFALGLLICGFVLASLFGVVQQFFAYFVLAFLLAGGATVGLAVLTAQAGKRIAFAPVRDRLQGVARRCSASVAGRTIRSKGLAIFVASTVCFAVVAIALAGSPAAFRLPSFFDRCASEFSRLRETPGGQLLLVFTSSFLCCLCTGIGCFPFFLLPRNKKLSDEFVARANLFAAGIMVAVSQGLLFEGYEYLAADSSFSTWILEKTGAGARGGNYGDLFAEGVLAVQSMFLVLPSAGIISPPVAATATSTTEESGAGVEAPLLAPPSTSAFATNPRLSSALHVMDLGWGFLLGVAFIAVMEHCLGDAPDNLAWELHGIMVSRTPLPSPHATPKGSKITTAAGEQQQAGQSQTKHFGSPAASSEEDGAGVRRETPPPRTPQKTAKTGNYTNTQKPTTTPTGAPTLIFQNKSLILFLAMFSHSFAEGIAIGVANEGSYVSVALALHNIPEGLVIGLTLLAAPLLGASSPEAVEEDHNENDEAITRGEMKEEEVGDDTEDEQGSRRTSEEALGQNHDRQGVPTSSPASQLLLPPTKNAAACQPKLPPAVSLDDQRATPLEATLVAIVSSLPQPVMAVLSLLAVKVFTRLLPYGLSFAAGAMTYVSYVELWKDARESLSFWESALVSGASFVGFLAICQEGAGELLFATVVR